MTLIRRSPIKIKNMNQYLFSLFLLLLITSCSIKPQPIVYGTDGCHFCRMTIVDRQHAAQIVTDKGKAYKFDATECMLNYLMDIKSKDIALFLVNDYSNPGALINATQAYYLISEGIPSPMGAYLTAFGTQEGQEEAWITHKGDKLNWEQLKFVFGDYSNSASNMER